MANVKKPSELRNEVTFKQGIFASMTIMAAMSHSSKRADTERRSCSAIKHAIIFSREQ